MGFVCKICGFESDSKTGFQNHIRFQHSDLGLKGYYLKYINSEATGKCVVCGKEVPFISIFRGYRIHCCHECSQKDPGVRKRKKENTLKALQAKYGENVTNASQVPGSRDKTRKTKLERYGSENYNNLEKYKQTCLEKYGVENPNQSEEIKLKIRKTNLERYGNVFPANSEHGRKVAEEKNLKLYGVKHSGQRPDVIQKKCKTQTELYGGVLMQSPTLKKCIRKTWQKVYGVDHPSKDPSQLEKSRQTNLKKYGVKNLLSLPETHKKARQVMKEKYGVEYAMQVPEFQEKQKEHSKGAYRARKYTLKNGRVLTILSNMEKTFLEDCEENNLDVFKGDDVQYTFNGKEHTYHVDFRLDFPDGTKQLVEIKGSTPYYQNALESGQIDAKKQGAKLYTKKVGYRPYLFLLDYKKGDILKWI